MPGKKNPGIASRAANSIVPPEPGVAHRLHIVSHEIMSGGGSHRRKVAAGVVEKGESVVMARGENHIFHTAPDLARLAQASASKRSG